MNCRGHKTLVLLPVQAYVPGGRQHGLLLATVSAAGVFSNQSNGVFNMMQRCCCTALQQLRAA